MGNRAKRFRTFASFSTHNSAEPGEGSVLRQTRKIDCGTRKSLTCRLRKRLRARHWARGSARPERALWGSKDGSEAGLQPEHKRLAAPIKAVFIWGLTWLDNASSTRCARAVLWGPRSDCKIWCLHYTKTAINPGDPEPWAGALRGRPKMRQQQQG